MARYFYLWTPFVIIAGMAVLAASPYLALVLLMTIALGMLAALTYVMVWAPLLLSRAISRRWHGHALTPTALSPSTSVVRRTRSVPAGATVLLVNHSERDL